ncbi:hypothetical protein RF11_10898 [Thelohanellus kitauei]|uniref:Uncharacterized protein n=1 Tax=Thelohanellus kitauei TaxID=669202 RepID=A0A0C2IGT5_THEKT|nr:hypothetical protein RF11_10898 [Thelohanellus kitauei]
MQKILFNSTVAPFHARSARTNHEPTVAEERPDPNNVWLKPLSEIVDLLEISRVDNFTFPLRKPNTTFPDELILAINELISKLDTNYSYPYFIFAANKIFLGSMIWLKHGIDKPISRKFVIDHGKSPADPEPESTTAVEIEIRDTRRVISAVDS